SAVLAGHDHDYERLLIQGFPYFVIGTGGANLRTFARVVEGSQRRVEGNYGAVLVTARTDSLSFQFYTRAGELKDSYTMTRSMTPSGDGVRTPRPTGTRAPRQPVRPKSGAPAR
ncbi:MAG TPA: hypothetical protein VGQ24_08850, partial [Gemmatimonadales bacterium]|nr:hypothetical protein [Gemmatimonadales bacterium]